MPSAAREAEQRRRRAVSCGEWGKCRVGGRWGWSWRRASVITRSRGRGGSQGGRCWGGGGGRVARCRGNSAGISIRYWLLTLVLMHSGIAEAVGAIARSEPETDGTSTRNDRRYTFKRVRSRRISMLGGETPRQGRWCLSATQCSEAFRRKRFGPGTPAVTAPCTGAKKIVHKPNRPQALPCRAVSWDRMPQCFTYYVASKGGTLLEELSTAADAVGCTKPAVAVCWLSQRWRRADAASVASASAISVA